MSKKKQTLLREQMHTRAASNSERISRQKEKKDKKKNKMKERPATLRSN